MKLNSKQELFCREYSLDLNATQAYIRAGYSKKGASVSAYKLLTNTRIHERVQELFDERAERTEITSDRVLTEAWNNYVVLRDREELVEIINGAIGLEKLLAAVRLKADLFCNRMLSGLEDHVSATPETLIRQLDIPWRVVVALYRADVKRVGQLRELTVTDVMRIARIGEKSGALLAPYLNPDQSSVTLLNE